MPKSEGLDGHLLFPDVMALFLHLQTTIPFAIVACFALICSAAQTTQPAGWEQKDYGQQILRPFQYAPFPHPSRAGGYKRVTTTATSTYAVPGHYDDSTVG